MAKAPRGVPTIVALMKAICRPVRKYGTSGIATWTTPAIAAALTALETACRAWEDSDDHPGEIDITLGGYEDDPDHS